MNAKETCIYAVGFTIACFVSYFWGRFRRNRIRNKTESTPDLGELTGLVRDIISESEDTNRRIDEQMSEIGTSVQELTDTSKRIGESNQDIERAVKSARDILEDVKKQKR